MRKPVIAMAFIGLFAVVLYIGLSIPRTPTSVSNAVQPILPPSGLNDMTQFPVYPGANRISNEIVSDPSVETYGKRYTAVWDSADEALQISRWYQDAIVKSGWTISMYPANQAAAIQQIEFQKVNATVTVSIIRRDTMSEITLDYRPGPVMEEGEAGQ